MTECDLLGVPQAEWRLVATAEHDGATNMAIDEAILVAVSEGRARPTIRFYGWRPPCVSIGYGQSMRGAIDLEACVAQGYEWVRRPTGGRAVLHIDELTYSIAAPHDEPRVRGDIVTSYRRLSRGLVAGLRHLGARVDLADGGGDGASGSAACFDVPSHYEVTALGRKLVGSAQARRRGVVLQHGALPLRGDVGRLAEVLALSKEERETLHAKLAARAVALDEVLGRLVSWGQAMEALAVGFEQALKLVLVREDLAPHELAAATRLQSHYASDRWLYSR